MEKVTFQVRKAVMEDIPEIQKVSKEAFGIYAESAGIAEIVGPLEEIHEYLKRELENKLVLVALLDGVIVESVRVEINPDKTAYLSRFDVAGKYQGKRIGKILMDAVDKFMVEYGVRSLYLHTASRMFSLVRFYYGRGFFIESTTKDRGYIRALLCKEYKTEEVQNFLTTKCEHQAVI